MSEIEIDADVADRLRARGITFNRAEGIMLYPVHGTFWGATRPLKPTLTWALDVSGFFDRINMVRWAPTRREFNEMWEWHPPRGEVEGTSLLLEVNRRLWDIEWEEVNEPPEEMVRALKRHLDRLYAQAEQEHRIPFDAGLRSARDGTNISHVLTAYAVLETVQKHDDEEKIPSIDYEGECGMDAMRYLERYVHMRMTGVLSMNGARHVQRVQEAREVAP